MPSSWSEERAEGDKRGESWSTRDCREGSRQRWAMEAAASGVERRQSVESEESEGCRGWGGVGKR